MADASEEKDDLGVVLRVFPKLVDARERGLVLAAAAVTHVIQRDGDTWVLKVAPEDLALATAEMAAYDGELSARGSRERPEVAPKVAFWSVPLVATIMVGFAVAQAEMGHLWREAGVASSEMVVGRGEWWRTVTALTLHGDVPHVLANLSSGLVFGALLFAAFGQGLAWLLIVISGALGNALNMWVCFPQPYRSLGASTAVFGALGLLVGDALARLLRHREGRSWWVWVLPLGAGVALLAFLGAGEGKANVDVLGHLWGFAVGLPAGAVVSLLTPDPNGARLQWLCGLAALAVLALAWVFACAHGAC